METKIFKNYEDFTRRADKKTIKAMKKTIEQMEQALRDINFYVGGLSDEGIEYYYNKMMTENKQKDEKAFDTHGSSDIAPKYRDWDILETLPEGWVIDKYCGSPLYGFVFCTNGKSILNGGKRALVRAFMNVSKNN